MLEDCLHPWLQMAWQRIRRQQIAGRLPHAYLLTGAPGVGKSAFARFLARSVLCSQSTDEGWCGACDSCLLWAAGTHPDSLRLAPPDGKQVITVDQVRETIEELELTPQCGQRKVAVIDPADAMNTNAANGLLKTLEEPAASDMIILVSSAPGFMPATIRSRCQVVSLVQSPDDTALARDWLAEALPEKVADLEALMALAPGQPLKVFELADADYLALRQAFFDDMLDVIAGRKPLSKTAANYAKTPTRALLTLMLHWYSCALKLTSGVAPPALPEAERKRLEPFANALGQRKIINIYNKLQSLYAIDSASFKTEAVLEGIFADMRLIHINQE